MNTNEKKQIRDFRTCFEASPAILMEGALGERLKREYGIGFDEQIDMGALAYSITGRKALETLWGEYAGIACAHNMPFICTTPTRRSNRERIAQTKYGEGLFQENVLFLRKVQERLQKEQRKEKNNLEMYIGALLGCRGDAYTGKGALSLEESREFHSWEASLFAKAGVDFYYAALMPTLNEACGMALALAQYDIPYIISFTITRNGCLIDGHTIAESIAFIDHKIEEVYGEQDSSQSEGEPQSGEKPQSNRKPICYMTNCVHPDIAYQALKQPFNDTAAVHQRFRGIQANTSALDYADLDDSVELKTSDPEELAEAMMRLREFPDFKIWGGCCGTDGRHMQAIADRLCSW